MEDTGSFEIVVSGMLFRFQEFYEGVHLRYNVNTPNRTDLNSFVLYADTKHRWHIENPHRLPDDIALMKDALGYAVESYKS